MGSLFQSALAAFFFSLGRLLFLNTLCHNEMVTMAFITTMAVPVNQSSEIRARSSVIGPCSAALLRVNQSCAPGRLLGWLPAGADAGHRAAPSSTPGVAAGVDPKTSSATRA
jgi:hypothetical protein